MRKFPLKKSWIKRANHFWFRYLQRLASFIYFSKEITGSPSSLSFLIETQWGLSAAPSSRVPFLFSCAAHVQPKQLHRWWRESRSNNNLFLISCAIPRPSFDYYVSIIRTMPSPTSVLQTQSEKKSDKNATTIITKWTCTNRQSPPRAKQNL